MTGFLGADTEALRELAQLFKGGARALEQTASPSLDRALGVAWTGPDAEQFRSTCQHLRSQLSEVHDAIRDRAACLEAESEEQDNASLDDSPLPDSGPETQLTPQDIVEDFPFSSGDGRSWEIPDIFPPISPHEWVPPLLKEGADAVADKVEKGLPKAERFLKKGTPLIPDMYDAGRHYLNGETAEGSFATMRGLISVVPYLGTAVDVADLGSSGDPRGSLLERAEDRYVEMSDDPDSPISRGEREGLRIADEHDIENEYGRNLLKSLFGTTEAWENMHEDENGDLNPWLM